MTPSAPIVKDFMTPNPITVKPSESIETVVKVLAENRISGLPVVDDTGQVVGIISEGDLLVRESPLQPPLYLTLLGGIIYFDSPAHFHQHMKKALGMSVQDVMTSKPITTKPETSLADAAHVMLDKKINRLPVLDQNQALIGIITRHDLVCALRPISDQEN